MSTAYKAGELVLIETGEYSDKSWHGPFRVLKDFDIREQTDRLKADFKPEAGAYSSEPSPYDVPSWLTKEGFLEDVECRSVHVGSYGEIQIDS